ncbi:hypothetical protein Taro_026305 [Colocasia esculenta]|uniref:Uncharacterized protein n=1 Tax=Colocasia esculenta TaxID=4460 RepID=A0A843VEV2_COLES|nr:hypothetical protein [Colocasia esculenta]
MSLNDIPSFARYPKHCRPSTRAPAHLKDGPYINKSIHMYEELVVICGDDQATGSFSRTVEDFVVDVDSTSVDAVNEETSETPPPPRIVEDHSISSKQNITNI